jgi:hypothetical protein
MSPRPRLVFADGMATGTQARRAIGRHGGLAHPRTTDLAGHLHYRLALSVPIAEGISAFTSNRCALEGAAIGSRPRRVVIAT